MDARASADFYAYAAAVKRRRRRRAAAGGSEPVTIEASIAADNDDGVYFFGWYGDTSDDLGTGVTQGLASGLPFRAGFRFAGVAVPQGAVISAASIALTVRGVTGASFGNLFGLASDDAPEWSGSHTPFSADRTTAFTPLTAANTASVDVIDTVQEIVNRPGWVSGNAMAFFGDDAHTDGENVVWDDYSNDAGLVAVLEIAYAG